MCTTYCAEPRVRRLDVLSTLVAAALLLAITVVAGLTLFAGPVHAAGLENKSRSDALLASKLVACGLPNIAALVWHIANRNSDPALLAFRQGADAILGHAKPGYIQCLAAIGAADQVLKP